MSAEVSMKRNRWLHVAPWVIALLFVGFSLAWSMVVPPFETPDEVYHYAFARHIAQGNSLPIQSAEPSGPWEHEGSQAPLYYLITGNMTRAIAQDDFDALALRNPRANIGDPLFPGNKNFMLHSGAQHPLSATNLALHVGRWFSIVMGVVTLFAALGLARLAFPLRSLLPLVVMALIAAIPQFQFISASFSNDSLVTAISAVTLFWLGTLIAKPADEPIRWWRWLVLGILLGIAALTKLQALGLFLLAASVGVGITIMRRDWWLPLRAMLPVALPPLLIAGWWYWRNFTLYGDWSGVNFLLANNGLRATSIDLADLWLEFRGFRYSFWGLFGWFNLLLPNWLYTLLDALSIVAFVSALVVLILCWVRPSSLESRGARGVLLMAYGWSLLTFALLIYFALQATGFQGRLFFPAITALAVVFVTGLDALLQRLPAAARWGGWSALLGLLVAVSIWALVWLIPGAYRQPAPIAGLPANAQPLDLRFGDALELTGVSVPQGRFTLGEDVPVTLYLRTSAPLEEDYQLFLQLLDEGGTEIANVTTHPGWGRNPTSLWQSGALYADTYPVRITGRANSDSPLLARLYTGFVDPATEDAGRFPLVAVDSAGTTVTPFVATVAINPPAPNTTLGESAQTVGAHFGNVIEIAEIQTPDNAVLVPGETFTVTLLYNAIGQPATNYVGYVHLLDTAGNQVAGYDQEPAPNRFPTSAWRNGDHIRAEFPLALPADLSAGEYTLVSGLYEVGSSGALRLPVTGAASYDSGDGFVVLTTLAVNQREPATNP